MLIFYSSPRGRVGIVMHDLLDGSPMIVQRGEHWCCLLCLRQFKSEQQKKGRELHDDQELGEQKADSDRDDETESKEWWWEK